MSIATKLQKILDSKAAIKAAIAGKGGTITDATPLDEYAQAVQSIPSGSDEDLKKVIEGTTTALTIPSGTTKICDYGLAYRNAMTSVTLPAGLATIGQYAFGYCTNLASISIPNSVTTIGINTFQSCSYLTDVTLPNAITSLPNYMFRQCSQLRKLVVPDSVQTIGNSFITATTMEDLVLGAGVTTILGAFAASGLSNSLTIRIYATTPPTIPATLLPAAFAGKIYVPDANVNDYKTATNWSTWASFIYPLSDYTP